MAKAEIQEMKEKQLKELVDKLRSPDRKAKQEANVEAGAV